MDLRPGSPRTQGRFRTVGQPEQSARAGFRSGTSSARWILLRDRLVVPAPVVVSVAAVVVGRTRARASRSAALVVTGIVVRGVVVAVVVLMPDAVVVLEGVERG